MLGPRRLAELSVDDILSVLDGLLLGTRRILDEDIPRPGLTRQDMAAYGQCWQTRSGAAVSVFHKAKRNARFPAADSAAGADTVHLLDNRVAMARHWQTVTDSSAGQNDCGAGSPMTQEGSAMSSACRISKG